MANPEVLADAAIDEVFALFAAHGASDYVGEAVSQAEHATQCAELARQAGAGDAVVAGALLHDVGHMLGLLHPGKYERMGDCGVACHEQVGAQWLRDRGFPADTLDIVRGHVNAKRYLCWKTPSYLATLSPASTTTLGHQGGPMSEEEARAFEASPSSATILAMRRWDEQAKVPGLAVPPLESYRGLLKALLLGVTSGASDAAGGATAAAAAGGS